MLSAKQAFDILAEGNRRFTSNVQHRDNHINRHNYEKPEGEYKPFAIVLECSDSNASAEVIFDQTTGGLFVISIIGNMVTKTEIESIEYAIHKYSIPLVVIMGHSPCNVIITAIDEVKTNSPEKPLFSRHIVDENFRSLIEPLLNSDKKFDIEHIIKDVVKKNVLHGMMEVRNNSKYLGKLIHQGKINIVGAEFSSRTGSVEFFE